MMKSIADNWWNEDHRDLFRSTELVASEARDASCLGASFDTILNDLELYDDPRQAAGAWLFENELQLAHPAPQVESDVARQYLVSASGVQ